MRHILFSISILTIFITSCKKDAPPEYNSDVKGKLTIEFDNIAGASDLELNTGIYTNAASETFNVTKLKYFVSNFILTNVNGTVYTVPQDSSYFLIDESDDSTQEATFSLPEGEYKTLTFTVGVDSLRSAADISERTGPLDPSGAASDMIWDANNGYIFFKLEGTSDAVTTIDDAFSYNIGGFGGISTPTANNIKTITLDLSARGTPKVKTTNETEVHLMVDVLKALNGSTNMSFASSYFINSPAAGIVIANNYADMFRHDHTHIHTHSEE